MRRRRSVLDVIFFLKLFPELFADFIWLPQLLTASPRLRHELHTFGTLAFVSCEEDDVDTRSRYFCQIVLVRKLG